jgi:hypothetical protein
MNRKIHDLPCAVTTSGFLGYLIYHCDLYVLWATLDAIPRINSFVVDDYVPPVSSCGFFTVPPIGIFYQLDGDVIAAMGREIHGLSCAGKPLASWVARDAIQVKLLYYHYFYNY